MEQDWLITTLKFIRLNLGILLISLGIFVVLIWTGVGFINSFSRNTTSETELVSPTEGVISENISATATVVATPSPVVEAPSAPEAVTPPATAPAHQAPTASPSATPIMKASAAAELRATALPTPKPTPSATPKPILTQLPTSTPTMTPQPTQAPIPTTKGGLPLDGATATQQTQNPGTYTVVKGDSTWKVAVKFFGNGYRYVEIEKANNLKHNQHLSIGQVLTVPDKQTIESSNAPKPSEKITTQQEEKTGKTYTVKAGDSLWAIAHQELGSPYRWTELYSANTKVVGSNPHLIYPGQSLKLPAAPTTATPG